MKKQYEKPQLRSHGDIRDVIRGGSLTGLLDGQYPVGTPSDFRGGLFS